MKEPQWILRVTVLALQEEPLSEFGGVGGVPDAGLLNSTLNRPPPLFHFGRPSNSQEIAFLTWRGKSLAVVAAARVSGYGQGLAQDSFSSCAPPIGFRFGFALSKRRSGESPLGFERQSDAVNHADIIWNINS